MQGVSHGVSLMNQNNDASESQDEELSRRRLEERVEKSLRWRYSIMGGIVVAIAGLIFAMAGKIGTQHIENFTMTAQAEFTGAKKAQEQATTIIIDALKKAEEIQVDLRNAQAEVERARTLSVQVVKQAQNFSELLSKSIDISNDIQAQVDQINLAVKELAKGQNNIVSDMDDVIKKAGATKENIVVAQQKAVKAENTRFLVGLVSYGVNPDIFDKVSNYLYNEQGYSNRGQMLLAERASWLSRKPTVLFYVDKNRRKAQIISDKLYSLTGIRFQISRGAGFGVDENEKEWTIIVHLVGE